LVVQNIRRELYRNIVGLLQRIQLSFEDIQFQRVRNARTLFWLILLAPLILLLAYK